MEGDTRVKMVLGYDFGGTKVDIGVGDSLGNVIEQRRAFVGDYSELRTLVLDTLAIGRSLRKAYEVSAIGVSTMGITSEDKVALAPNIRGWSELHLPRLFRQAFRGLPVRFENDVRAACYADLKWGALKECQQAAYLNMGTGIAMALVFNGQVYSGAHGAAGEIAYLWRGGELGYAAGQAPFEEQYGGGALDRTVQERFPPYRTLKDVFDRIDVPMHRRFVDEVFEEIGRRVGHVLLCVDVDVVSVGGGISRRFDIFAPIFERVWANYLPFPPRLVMSQFVDRAGLQGAIALAALEGDRS